MGDNLESTMFYQSRVVQLLSNMDKVPNIL